MGSRREEATCRACVEVTPELDRGEAGASAARRFERLHESRESRARKQYGRFGGVYLALTDEPQSTKAWDAGSRGERALGRYLETLHDGDSIVVLHDRRIPGTRANIDHVVVAPSGIFVVDAKNYAGKVQRIDRGGWFSTDWRLIVGRRDCTRLVHGMAKQVAAIRAAVGEPASPSTRRSVSSRPSGRSSHDRSRLKRSGSAGRRLSANV